MATLRESVEKVSLPVVRSLAGLPRLLVFVLALALILGGLFLPGYGWLLLAAAVAILLWLLYLAWPRLTGVERLMRIAILGVMVALLMTRIFPRG